MSRHAEIPCLIIGSGIAGLSTALQVAESGLEVGVITSAAKIQDTNTWWAQGGIIYRGEHDRAELLVDDILSAGCHANYLPAVRQLAEMGPTLVDKLLLGEAGTDFDREADGRYHLTQEGAHSQARILHHGDTSGRVIEETLVRRCRENPRIHFIEATTAVNLLMSSYHPTDRALRHETARCLGAFVFDQKEGTVYPIRARHTVLATGGIGQLFLHNTNSKHARGDGLAMAHRAGCRLEGLEFIQFHPTTFFHPSSRRFLISEALRGEGAVLVNQSGERFLQKYLSGYEPPELGPRDKVARAIHQEMLQSGAECVYLDISHRPAEWIKERFPFLYQSCLKQGVDMTRTPIPVVPGAHYHCGGIWTDLTGKTSVPHLWAVGETACTGLHGANRLASTSLLEGLVWGTRAGREIADETQTGPTLPFAEIEEWKSETTKVDPSFLSQDWMMLKHTMWNYVGLIKTDARLLRAEGILTELARGIDMFYRKAALSDALIGLRHASLAALLILEACKKNPRSLGCYLREDLEI